MAKKIYIVVETYSNDDITDNIAICGAFISRKKAVEKVEGQYDDEYLGNVTKLINTLGENGIYTLIDTHQDLFYKKFT